AKRLEEAREELARTLALAEAEGVSTSQLALAGALRESHEEAVDEDHDRAQAQRKARQCVSVVNRPGHWTHGDRCFRSGVRQVRGSWYCDAHSSSDDGGVGLESVKG